MRVKTTTLNASTSKTGIARKIRRQEQANHRSEPGLGEVRGGAGGQRSAEGDVGDHGALGSGILGVRHLPATRRPEDTGEIAESARVRLTTAALKP